MWLQVRAAFSEPPLDFSPYIEAYREFGIENTSETDRSLTGCLPNVRGASQMAVELKEILLAAGADEVEVSELPEENWDEVWRRFFKPRRVGERFVVRPTWEPYEAEPEDVLLVLDPGQAFGTGDHPTTRMCLELLEELDLSGQRVLDIGCGSGILSIAAAKLGAQVSACDIDPIAVEVTNLNAALNGVEFESWVETELGVAEPPIPEGSQKVARWPKTPGGGGVRSEPTPEGSQVPQDEYPIDSATRLAPLPPSRPPSRTYNLVLSNIISATLIRMAHQVEALLEPGGAWIVSGIIEQNWAGVLSAAEKASFALAVERCEDGWVAARFHRLEVDD